MLAVMERTYDMKTKNPQKKKNDRELIHPIQANELRRVLGYETNSSSVSLYIRQLRKKKLIEKIGSGRETGYVMPSDWQSEEYLKRLWDSYPRIYLTDEMRELLGKIMEYYPCSACTPLEEIMTQQLKEGVSDLITKRSMVEKYLLNMRKIIAEAVWIDITPTQEKDLRLMWEFKCHVLGLIASQRRHPSKLRHEATALREVLQTILDYEKIKV